MRITINHPDKAMRTKIMDWLFLYGGLEGNEDHLIDEKLTDVFSRSEIWILEQYLSKWFDETIELPKDLKFIELK
jgi:hypothetical protein